MDDKIKEKLTELYDYHCILLSKHGEVTPIYFLIKDSIITPMIVSANNSVQFDVYSSWVISQANKIDADALVLISEHFVVTGNKNDEDMKALIKGKIKTSDHPENKQYLILTYMEAGGGLKESLLGKIESDPLGVKFIRDQEWALDDSSQMAVSWKG